MFSKGVERLSAYWWVLGAVLLSVILGLSYTRDAAFGLVFFTFAEEWIGRLALVYFLVLMGYATLRANFERSEAYFIPKYRLFRDFALLYGAYWLLMLVHFWTIGMELLPVRLVSGLLALFLTVGMPIAVGRAWFSERGLMAWQAGLLFWVWVVWMMGHANFIGASGASASGLVYYWISFFALVVLIFWRSVYVLLQWMEAMKQRSSR